MNEELLVKLDEYGKVYQRLSHKGTHNGTTDKIFKRLSSRIVAGLGILLNKTSVEGFEEVFALGELSKLHNRITHVSLQHEGKDYHNKVLASIEKVINSILEY